MAETEFTVAKDLSELNRRTAELIADSANQAIARNGRFTFAFSGGSTPRKLYELLATPEWSHRIDWTRTEAFWSDERLVPPDDPDSNYRMTRDALLSKISVPEENIHRVKTELLDPQAVADDYQERIYQAFGKQPPAVPELDFILLGLGENAHTASLFPNSHALSEKERLVVAPFVREVSGHRISFTVPLIDAASKVAFLVAGANKANTVREVLSGPHDPERLPAQLIRPAHGTLYWMMDEPAAIQLPRK